MEEILKQMMLVYEVMGKDEFAQAIANMLWNIYTKSKEKGFSEDQAMAITLSFSKFQQDK